MSSMRNAVQRRNHKERAQPAKREKWGLLEKHKDYSLRAQDYNAKKSRLKALRSKATDRNPDEFNHGMLSAESRRGRKVTQRGSSVLDNDTVKLLKTQDSGYLRVMIQQTRRQIEKLEQLLLTDIEAADSLRGEPRDAPAPTNKLVYVDDVDAQKETYAGASSSDGQSAPTETSGLQNGRPENQPHSSNRRLEQTRKLEEARRKQRRKWKALQNAKLQTLIEREKVLRAADGELERQRGKMANSVGGVTKTGVKFKMRERKR